MSSRLKWWCVAVPMLVMAPAAAGQCIPTLCALTIAIQSDPGGITLGGSGTAAASMSFGTMSAFAGSTPTGVTKTVTSPNWTISTPFDVKVSCTNLLTLLPCTLILTPTYNFYAQLQSTDTINTWKIGGSTIVSSTTTTLTTTGTYGAVVAYSFALTIPFSEAAGPISNTINFTAISN